jgi:hypothetical protein
VAAGRREARRRAREHRGDHPPKAPKKAATEPHTGFLRMQRAGIPLPYYFTAERRGGAQAPPVYIRKHQHKTPEYECKCVRTLYIYIATCKFTFGYGREGPERQGGAVCGCGAESRDDARGARQGEKGGWAMASQSLPAPFHPPWRKKRTGQSRAGEWRRRDRYATH